MSKFCILFNRFDLGSCLLSLSLGGRYISCDLLFLYILNIDFYIKNGAWIVPGGIISANATLVHSELQLSRISLGG